MSGEEGNADFQAGVATATAANAAEDAQEAQETAEGAEATAETAVDIALSASETAWDAQIEVENLRDEMRTGFSEIKDLLSAGGKGTADDGPPAPEPKIKEDPPATEDKAPEQEKPAKAKNGLGMWR